ncbi:ABC transporter permease subunit/CPBP intramembrane protease, partial [Planctomycetota bacterium]
FVMLFMPFVSYPLIIILMTQLPLTQTKKIQEKPARIALINISADPGFEAYIQEKAGENNWEITDLAGLAPAEAVLKRQIAIAVSIEPAPDRKGKLGTITILYSAADEKSGFVQRDFHRICTDYAALVVSKRLENLGQKPDFILPYTIKGLNVASAERLGAKLLGRNITLIMIVMVIVGAFYPALEVTAGERERRTLETLLVSPAGRMEIAFSKYLAVLACSFTTGLLNLISMVLTFSLLMPRELMERFTVSLSPFTIAVMVFILIPLSAFISAVFLGFSTFARSYKEGQSYLSPLVMVLSLPALITVIPGASLTVLTGLIPVANIALLASDLMMQEYTLLNLAIVLLSTAFYAWLGISWTARLFSGEELLYRVGNPFKSGRLTALHAFLVTAAAGALLVLFSGMGDKSSLPPWVFAVIAPQLSFVILPVLIVKHYKLNIREIFRFELPVNPVFFLKSLGGLLFTAGIVLWLPLILPSDSVQEYSFIRDFIRQMGVGFGGLLILIAVIPGIAEEILFRGFVLRGVSRSFGVWKGLVLAGLLFGSIHILPHKILPVSILGIALGFVVIRTGSIFPAMLAHILNNAFSLYQIYYSPEDLPEEDPWVNIVWGTGLLIAGLLLLYIDKMKRGDQPEGDPGQTPG